MKIAIEAQRIFRKKKHGMDMVILEVIKELQKIDTTNDYYILVQPDVDRCVVATTNFHIIEINCKCYPLWEQVAAPLYLNRIKPDLIHCTSNTAPLFISKSIPLVVTLHDVIFFEPQQRETQPLYQTLGRIYRRLIVPHVIKKCSKIITVSNSEAKNIKALDPALSSKIKVVYNGYGSHFLKEYDSQKTLLKHSSPDDKLLFLGNTDPKKNVIRTLKAYAQYIEKSDIKRHLIIADLQDEIVNNLLKELNLTHIKPYISLTDYVPNSELPLRYQNSWALLYTSTRESFGIPLLEGMASGIPVITGNASALPEIAGDAAILCDTFSVDAIANSILQLEHSPELYQQCVRNGYKRIEHFSWKKTSIETLKIYEEYDKRS